MTVRYLRPQERITMKSIVPKQRSLTVSILSLSLLTVMAGVAVSAVLLLWSATEKELTVIIVNQAFFDLHKVKVCDIF